MTSLRLALAGLLAAVGVVVLTPTTSYACSCVRGGVPQLAEWADTVFSGTLTEVTPPPERGIMSSGDPATYDFDVDTVHEGDVGETTVVTSAVSGASCGLEGMRVGRAYVVFASGDPGRYEANLCGGTAPASAGLTREVDKVLGPGHPPETLPFGGIVALLLELLRWE